MNSDPAGRAPVKPSPPPEAVLIRLVREAAGIKLPAAAKTAGISKARWSQVESGYEARGGDYKPVQARAATIAHMAHAVGLDPDRLAAEGQRPDAAVILREIQRRHAREQAATDYDVADWIMETTLRQGCSAADAQAFAISMGWQDKTVPARIRTIEDVRKVAAFVRMPLDKVMVALGVAEDSDFHDESGERRRAKH